jgi:hypothetical protein
MKSHLKSMIVATMFLLGIAAYSQAKPILLLRLLDESGQLEDIRSIEHLYKESLETYYQGNVVFASENDALGDKETAIAKAKELGFERVIFSKVLKLGGKWIFTSSITNIDGSDYYSQRSTIQTVEDFEPLSDRIANSLINQKTMEQVVNVDNVSEADSIEPLRRKSLQKTGLALGYFYPINKSFPYKEDGEIIQKYTQVIKLGWIGSWELKKNFALNTELIWNVPVSIGGDLNALWLKTKTDITPVLGGGLGLHFVTTGKVDSDDRRRYSGPTLNAQAGMMFFRTYQAQVYARVQYHMILNSNLDNGVSFDVSILYQKREKIPSTYEPRLQPQKSSFGKYLLGALGVGLLLIIVS